MRNRTKYLLLVALVLSLLVFVKYYPSTRLFLKKQTTISGFRVTKPEGFLFISDESLMSTKEPFSINFGKTSNSVEKLEGYRKFKEKKGIQSTYENVQVGCKNAIGLKTIESDGKSSYEDIKIAVNSDTTIFVSMPFDNNSPQRENFLKDFLSKNVICLDTPK